MRYMASHFTKHVFFCTNIRENNEACCGNHNAQKMRDYTKQMCKNKNLDASVRINQAGCLGRCEHGPVMVVYPEATWYTYVDEEDINEIIEQDLVNNKVVTHLAIAGTLETK
jgi:(2Fe-2S) ferredoxin